MKVNFETITLSTIIKVAVFLVIVAIAGNVFISNYKSSYKEMIYDWRKQKNEYFKNSPDSPIEYKEDYTALSYFDPNPSFKTEARLTLLHDSTSFVVNRTDGRKEKYMRYAIANFKLKGKEYNLILLRSLKLKPEDIMLFLPFTDKTSGELTYGGGRYLDIEHKEPNKVVIDFNYAYNPYCAYNPRFSCPIPPKENYLDLEILAGEKIYEKTNLQHSDSLTID